MSRRPLMVVGVAFLSSILVWFSCGADILHLKDGSSIEGAVTAVTEASVTIETDDGIREYPASSVDYVEREGSPEEAEPPAEASDSEVTVESVDPPPLRLSAEETGSLCLSMLGGLAADKRASRIGWGIAAVAVGTLFSLLVSQAVAGSGYEFQVGAVTFGLIAVPGALSLIISSPIEREHAKVLDRPASEQGRACGISFEKLAREAEDRRVRAAISDAAVGAFFLLIGYPYATVYYAVEVYYHLTRLSAVEKAYESYREQAGIAD